jgi:hypothetical protein
VSIRIEPDAIAAAVGERGPAAYLLTIGEDRPHAVSVAVSVIDGGLRVGAGRRTSANVAERRAVTLLWPLSAEHPDHTLLVDGEASVDDEGATITVVPTAAILHVATPSGPDRRC